MKRCAFLLALVLILSLFLCACGQNYDEMESYYSDPAEYYNDEAFGGGADYAASEAEMPAKSLGVDPEAVSAPMISAEKIIYTATLQMETTHFDETVSAFEASVARVGGYTQYSDVSGDTTYDSDGSVRVINRYASYTVSIPADKLDAFLAETSELGNVTSNNKSAENVTSRYTDYETRKNSLLTEETRLLELLAQADDIDALIALEERLSEVRYEIELLQSQLNDLDRRLAYSTVNLYLEEVRGYSSTASVTRTFGERLSDAFGSGWDNFVEGMEDFAVGMAEAIIPLLFLAAIVIVIVVIVRKNAKKRRAVKAAENNAEEKKPEA